MRLNDVNNEYSSSSSLPPPLPHPLHPSLNMEVMTPANVLVLGRKVRFSLAFTPISVPVTPNPPPYLLTIPLALPVETYCTQE